MKSIFLMQIFLGSLLWIMHVFCISFIIIPNLPKLSISQYISTIGINVVKALCDNVNKNASNFMFILFSLDRQTDAN